MHGWSFRVFFFGFSCGFPTCWHFFENGDGIVCGWLFYAIFHAVYCTNSCYIGRVTYKTLDKAIVGFGGSHWSLWLGDYFCWCSRDSLGCCERMFGFLHIVASRCSRHFAPQSRGGFGIRQTESGERRGDRVVDLDYLVIFAKLCWMEICSFNFSLNSC